MLEALFKPVGIARSMQQLDRDALAVGPIRPFGEVNPGHPARSDLLKDVPGAEAIAEPGSLGLAVAIVVVKGLQSRTRG